MRPAIELTVCLRNGRAQARFVAELGVGNPLPKRYERTQLRRCLVPNSMGGAIGESEALASDAALTVDARQIRALQGHIR